MNTTNTVNEMKRLQDEWLTNADMMKLLKCSQTKLYYMRKNKILPYVKFGGCVLFNRKKVMKLLLNNKLN